MGTTSKKKDEVGEPVIQVGILLDVQSVDFNLHTPYVVKGNEMEPGDYRVEISDGRIAFNGELFDELLFEAKNPHKDYFELKDVIIGVNFHWERKENQQFLGSLKFIVSYKDEKPCLSAVDIVSVEDYLKSVISSEMSSTSSLELLKAHAIISRSWLMSQICKEEKSVGKSLADSEGSWKETSTERIIWYDREDHDQFDVCADDHCQRYQGITRQTTDIVGRAVDETRGMVVTYDGKICDTRYSKCCGGMMETFENVWEPVVHPYLQAKRDAMEESDLPNLCDEEQAEEWIMSSPKSFCNTNNTKVLKQVLNDYDTETSDFFRWKVTYSQEEIAEIIAEKSGIEFGNILDLEPIERGYSGRLIKLKVIGTDRVFTFGKELEIRRVLSRKHLYSSAFVVKPLDENDEGIPQKFEIYGAGWGHGVGLCQIGAAMMAEEGYSHDRILQHYFTDTELTSMY
ncbi:MAG: SpoIID/LytB domain-containing protein [Fermentimonas sp.]|jgi:stage II sporulation protein D